VSFAESLEEDRFRYLLVCKGLLGVEPEGLAVLVEYDFIELEEVISQNLDGNGVRLFLDHEGTLVFIPHELAFLGHLHSQATKLEANGLK